MSVITDAIDILDRSMDYAHEHGFNILRYGQVTYEGPRCYIGTIKTVGGEKGLMRLDPISNPAVKLALDALDNLYPERLDTERKFYATCGAVYASGATIERMGLNGGRMYLENFIEDCERAKEVLKTQLEEFEVSEEVEANNHVLVEA